MHIRSAALLLPLSCIGFASPAAENHQTPAPSSAQTTPPAIAHQAQPPPQDSAAGARPTAQTPPVNTRPWPADPQELDRACRKGVMERCYQLGYLLLTGQGVPRDATRALALWESACAHGQAESCTDLGREYLEGTGGRKDVKQAEALRHKGCSLGDVVACPDPPRGLDLSNKPHLRPGVLTRLVVGKEESMMSLFDKPLEPQTSATPRDPSPARPATLQSPPSPPAGQIDDRRAVVDIKRGLAAWQQSCSVPGEHGLCISSQVPSSHPSGAKPARCAKAGWQAPDYKVHRRNSSLAAAGLFSLGPAIAAYADAGDRLFPAAGDATAQAARRRELTAHLAMALIALGDKDFEDIILLPTKPFTVNVSPAQGQNREGVPSPFAVWLEEIVFRASEARKLYQRAIELSKDSGQIGSIIATARIGQLFAHLANALYTLKIPAVPPTPEGMKKTEWAKLYASVFCEQIGDSMDPYATIARDSFARCVEQARVAPAPEWLAFCETSLLQLGAPKP